MPDSVGKRKRRDVTARKHAAREERRVARAGRKKDREAGLIEPGPPIGPAEQSEFLVVEPEADAAADAQSSEDKPSPRPEARPKSDDGKRPGEQTEERAGESAKESAKESAGESGGPGASAGSSSRSERT
jgi:outer membrane biosynthesis protein TonB